MANSFEIATVIFFLSKVLAILLIIHFSKWTIPVIMGSDLNDLPFNRQKLLRGKFPLYANQNSNFTLDYTKWLNPIILPLYIYLKIKLRLCK